MFFWGSENTKRSGGSLEERQQSFVIKFFWLRSRRPRQIDATNYWSPLEVTYTLKTRSGTRSLFSSSVRLVRRLIAAWNIPNRCGRAFSPVSVGLSFRQCACTFIILQCLCYECERGPCPRPGFAKIQSTMGASYTIRPLKNQQTRGMNWADADPQWLESRVFWWNYNRWWVLISMSRGCSVIN
jgi:hypothetical protein